MSARGTRTTGGRRLLGALALTGALTAVAGCSADDTTLETIGETTADAIRDAGSVQFRMTTPDESFEGAAVYEEGDVAAIHVATTTTGEEKEEWVIDGEYWLEQPPTGPAQSDSIDPAEFAMIWDWAQVQEDFADAATDVEKVDAREIDGVMARGYELTSDDRTETWWIDDDGKMLEFEYVFEDGQTGGGSLFAYGDDIEITVP
ncbi:hypothetical protein [Microbacterium sp. G2-8]|uniref:hypothetical protein n=1 Tax=Microbacterium sp. G2-8 TaxID=2842454 RepID=UPI001C8A4446|nr:hypothetical protein [Microbacterium sp. G2-8]